VIVVSLDRTAPTHRGGSRTVRVDSGHGGCEGAVQHRGQRAQGALVELVDAPGHRAEHVALGSYGTADVLLMVGEGVDGLDHSPGCAAPGCYPQVVIPELGQGVALVLGHGAAAASLVRHRRVGVEELQPLPAGDLDPAQVPYR